MNQLSTYVEMPSSRWQTGSGWDRFKATFHRFGEAVRPFQGPGRQVASWPLAANAFSVPSARRLTRARLTTWGLEGFSDIAELLVSELVTNVLLHAPGPCRLTISAQDGLLRCEVEDTSTLLPQAHPVRELDEGGRGLHLLDLLACCWGGARTPAGKVMWFELPTGVSSEI